MIQAEAATVYRAGGRRYLTARGAWVDQFKAQHHRMPGYADAFDAGATWATAGVARELPKLDDDDEVAFPNDSGLAVIHEATYWKLRGCEDICAALGAEPPVARELDADAERLFDVWWNTPSASTGHPPRDVLEGFSAKAGFFAARSAAQGAAPTGDVAEMIQRLNAERKRQAEKPVGGCARLLLDAAWMIEHLVAARATAESAPASAAPNNLPANEGK